MPTQPIIYAVVFLLAVAFGAGAYSAMVKLTKKEVNGLGARATRIDRRQQQLIVLIGMHLTAERPELRAALVHLLEDK
jgi:hypothetical protein